MLISLFVFLYLTHLLLCVNTNAANDFFLSGEYAFNLGLPDNPDYTNKAIVRTYFIPISFGRTLPEVPRVYFPIVGLVTDPGKQSFRITPINVTTTGCVIQYVVDVGTILRYFKIKVVITNRGTVF